MVYRSSRVWSTDGWAREDPSAGNLQPSARFGSGRCKRGIVIVVCPGLSALPTYAGQNLRRNVILQDITKAEI